MIVLGSTGSIGKNALSLAWEYGLSVIALACASNYKLLNAQIKDFAPKLVFIKDKKVAKNVKHSRVFCGDITEFLRACASECDSSKTTLINALVGFGGLVPSKLAGELGFNLALANKESLVAGGAFLDTAKITPIDSEHFGLKFLLSAKLAEPKRLIITASGGAVVDIKSPKKIASLSPKKALKHPSWNMGAKITIDSASMANKLFEVLEAYHLYGIKNIDALIERTSKVHAIVSFDDGSSTAHISLPDMRLAIAHALNLAGNSRIPSQTKQILPDFDFLGAKFTFEKISLKKYPIFSLKNEVLKKPKSGVIINAANDVMVAKFLAGKCAFGDIAKNILKIYEKYNNIDISSFEDVLEADLMIRKVLK